MNVFVFGSNLGGIHGSGAAKQAREMGFPIYLGVGPGPGPCYAIPTKDCMIETLPLNVIEVYVKQFIAYAKANKMLTFKVTMIGCGLAGYRHEDIAPMFLAAPSNCYFDTQWKPYLGELHNYWGTY